MSEFTPQTVLVYVGLDRVGDSLLKLPFVRGLRAAYPDARITWLAGKDTSVYAGVMASSVAGLIDEVIDDAQIGLSPKELFRRPLAGRHFDLVIDTQRVALATLILYRVRHRTFISPFGNFALSSRKPPAGYRFPKAMQRQLLDLLEIATGRTIDTPQRLDIPVDSYFVSLAEQLLPAGPAYVGLSPGAGGLPKCWPLANFIALGRELAAAGRVPVFILGPAEEGWRAEIEAELPMALFPLQRDDIGKTSGFPPQLTIALAGRLAAAVSNDSGTGHMLAVGGTALVSLFGRTVPEKFTPMSGRLTIIKAQDFGGREMHFIPVPPVLAAVEAALAG